MALSPELKLMISAHANAQRELDQIEEDAEYIPTIREQLGWLGLQKASKAELREIIITALERAPDA